MSKIKGFCRRFMACLMVCFTLSFTVAGDYLGVQSMKVYATGVTEVMILKALIEAIMASMGLSFSSTTDLNNAAAGLNSAMNQYEDYSYGTASPFKELQEQVSSGLTLGMLPSFCFTQTTYKFLQNYCYNLASEQVSSASDVVIPFVEMSDVSSERISFSSYSESELLNKISYGKSIHVDNSSGSEVTSVYKIRDSDYYDITQAKMIVSQIIQYSSDVILLCLYYVPVGNSCAIILNNSESSYVYVSGSSISGSGSVFKKYSTGISEMNYYLMSAAGTYGDKSSYSHIYRDSLFYDSANDCFYAPRYSQYSPFLSNKEPYGLCFSMESYNTANYNSLPAKASSNSVVTVYFNSDTNTTVYSSWEEYQMMAFTNAFRPSSRVYGTSATAKAPTADGTAGTITFELKEPTMTAQVEQAVNNALAANPSITEEELNAVASDVIAAQNGTTDAVNQNTATLSSLLTSILATVRSIAIDVSAISVSGGGSAALDWTDVQGAFDEVEVSGSSDNDSDNDDENDDGKPKVWVPPEMKAVGFLAPLLMLLGGALSNLSSFQSAILGTLEGVEEWIMDIPENIAHALDNTFAPTFEAIGTAVGTIAGNLEEWIMDIPESIMELLSVHDLPLDLLLEGVLSLPLGIADALEDVFAGGISVTIPDFLDYTSLLERIIELLEQFFMIDTAVLSASLVQLELVWEGKLPFGDKLFGLYQQLRFPDTYVYPVIKVQTPDILRNFYSSDYIILFDCEDYKQYFLWARNIVKAWLWFCFGLSIFNHLRADFRIS